MTNPPEFREDTVIMPVLSELAQCLCEEIAASGLTEPCFCGVLPGAEVPYDYCANCGGGRCGQAWVRLDGAFPSSLFPQQDDGSETGGGLCRSPLAFRVELGIIRCAPLPDKNGNPPTVEQQFNATFEQMADRAAMLRAVECCLTVQDRLGRHVVEAYTPVSAGDCVGGVMTVMIPEGGY